MMLPLPDFHTHNGAPKWREWALVSSREAQGALWSIQRLPAEAEAIPQAAELAEAVALGEVGLDRRIDVPMERQVGYLSELVAVAEAFGKPLVVHCVRAYPELNRELKGFKGKILHHRFSGSTEELANQLALGRYISFSAIELERKSGLIRYFAEHSEYMRFFALESDDAPADLPQLYAAAAEILAVEPGWLAERLRANFKEFLGL